ncbi:AbrB family transcriptional regulator, partial [Chloroflexota bacterium]
IPAGIMVGALVATGAYQLVVGASGPWQRWYGRAGRLLLGTTIGAAFGTDVIAPLKAALLPMAGLIAAIICVGLILGWILHLITGLDPATAMISTLPGGVPAMCALAEDVGADATIVAAVHFARLTTILLVVPALIASVTGGTARAEIVTLPGDPVGLGLALATLALGLLGGFLALKVRIPTADLVGPMVVVGGFSLLGVRLGPMPAGFQETAVLLIGISVGAQTSRDSLRKLWQVALPAAAMVTVLIAAGLLLGWGLLLVTPLDTVTALLSGVPGGASMMPIIAQDLGGDIRLVAALHLSRQLVMLAVLPAVISYLVHDRWKRRTATTSLQSGEACKPEHR